MTRHRPRATYRLQFREGMTFARAATLVPYLARLGVSHVYASPVFTAVPGSTHGYDVADYREIDPVIGGRAGFEAFAAALAEAGLGLLLDMVPNHMGADGANPWWFDVLAFGPASPYAGHFDIDWSAPRLLLPTLGEPYGAALDAGKLSLGYDATRRHPVLRYYDNAFPLAPGSTADLFAALPQNLRAAGLAFAAATPGTIETGRAALAAVAGPEGADLDGALAALSADRDRLHALHEGQVYRLAHWRLGREALTYRRFFEVTGLAGVSVERPEVFRDVHALLLELAGEGAVHGVRIDHVDGLADPKGYLARLRAALPAGSWLIVEKILEPPEELGPDWPADGTSGYEVITAFSRVFTDPLHGATLDAAYADFLAAPCDYEAALAAAKRDIVDYNLAGEVDRLADRAATLAAGSVRTRDIGRDALRRAVTEMLAAFPVYRTYVTGRGVSDADRRVIEAAATDAHAARHQEDPSAVDFLASLLLLEVPDGEREEALSFATRFQQTTVPVAAKAVEDTLFYRYHRLIGLNEVGGDPSVIGGTVAAFHAEMVRRQETQPFGLTTTATHDTKRGEDARARLYVLSEAPAEWFAAVSRWWGINAAARAALADGPAPEPAVEWMLYQALYAVFPLEGGALSHPGDPEAGLPERFEGFLVKALREAKERTSWTALAADYEAAVVSFARHLLSPEAGEFREDFLSVCRPFWRAGALVGLAQALLKLTVPGVPDVYQGTEGWEFSLVDPDNRRPVAFDRLAGALDGVGALAADELLADWRSGRIKLRVLAAGLAARRKAPDLFADGAYRPLEVTGRHADRVIAFARILGDGAAVTVVPRLPFRLLGETDRPRVPAAAWEDTAVRWPRSLSGRTLADGFGTGATVLGEAGELVPVARLAAPMPVGFWLAA